jgi:hypothetical protein
MITKGLTGKGCNRWRRGGRLGAVLTGVALLGAYGWSATSSASTPHSSVDRLSTTTVVYAFDINSPADDLIAAPGTKAGVISAGDESMINDQLTVAHKVTGGYPIIGYDSGTCTFTRVSPDGQAEGSPYDRVLEHCVATAVLPQGSITVEGVITRKAGLPQPATLAITGGTAGFNGARGIVKVTFGSQFNVYTIVRQ